jgi:hypothetical protein
MLRHVPKAAYEQFASGSEVHCGDLASVVEAGIRLPEAVRTGMLAMVRAMANGPLRDAAAGLPSR